MKTAFSTKIKGSLLSIGLGLLSVTAFSQEHITLSLENITANSNTIEYDLFVINDGSTALKLSGCAYGINYSSSILNGGTPSDKAFSSVLSTRSLDLNGLKPMNMLHTNRDNFSQMRITTSPTAYANSPVLLSNVPYKVGHFKFTNTKPWAANSNPALSLNEFNVPGISTSCATAYVDANTNPKGFSVAKKNLSVRISNSPILNPTQELGQVANTLVENNQASMSITQTPMNANTKVNIYPNPTQDILHIDLTATAINNTVVKVLDMRGRVVKQIQARSEKGLNTLTVSLREVPSGIYTVQVYQDNALSFTDKLTKKD